MHARKSSKKEKILSIYLSQIYYSQNMNNKSAKETPGIILLSLNTKMFHQVPTVETMKNIKGIFVMCYDNIDGH